LAALIKPPLIEDQRGAGFRKAATVRSLRRRPLEDRPQTEAGEVFANRSKRCKWKQADPRADAHLVGHFLG